MKSTATIAVLLGIVFCFVQVNSESDALKQDLKEFRALMPKTKFTLIAGKHYIFDSQFRTAVKFIQSKEIVPIWKEITNNKEFKDVLQYLNNAGLDTDALLNKIAGRLHIPLDTKLVPMPRSMSSLVNELLSALPKKEITALMKKKLETSKDFKTLYDALISPEFDKLTGLFYNSKQLAPTFKILQSKHIDLVHFYHVFKTVLSWGK